MRRFFQPSPRSSRAGQSLPIGLVSLVAAGISLPVFPAIAQSSLDQAASQIVPGAAAALVPPASQLFDRSRVLLTLRPGETPQTLRQEAARRQQESSNGTTDATMAALAAARSQGDRILTLSLPSTDQESSSGAAPLAMMPASGDFAASLSLEAARVVEALRQMPQVASVEPNGMRFALQQDPADAFNQLLGTSQPAAGGQDQRATPDAGSIDQIIGGGTVRGPIVSGSVPVLPDDPLTPMQWHLFANASAQAADRLPGGTGFLAYRAGNSGNGTANGPVVAIIDTGLVAQHQDLARERILPGYDFITLPFVGNDGDGRDADPTDTGDGNEANACFAGAPPRGNTWHGSHVAGIAGAVESDNRLGITLPGAPVRIVPVRVLGRCGGFDSDIIDAMRWAAGLPVEGVPANPNPAKVLNMSLGGPNTCSAAFQEAVDAVLAAGTTIIVAAGNSAEDAQTASPASCAGVITVAASDARGIISPFSNYGQRIDIMAPGGDISRDDDRNGRPDGILSLVSGGYEFKEGTSMAAPLVAAAAALLLAQRPDLSPEGVRSALLSSALPRNAQQCPRGCGAGLLQIPSEAGQTTAGRR